MTLLANPTLNLRLKFYILMSLFHFFTFSTLMAKSQTSVHLQIFDLNTFSDLSLSIVLSDNPVSGAIKNFCNLENLRNFFFFQLSICFTSIFLHSTKISPFKAVKFEPLNEIKINFIISLL